MADELWTQAEVLAGRHYSTEFEVDTLPNGQPVYMARNPELPGCKAQGGSIDEAQDNLDEVRIDYINALLEENLPIPEPRQLISGNTRMTGTTRTYYFDEVGTVENEMDSILGKVTQPDERHFMYGIQLGGDLVKHG